MTNQQYQAPFPPPPLFYKLYTTYNTQESPQGPLGLNIQLDSLKPPSSLGINQDYKVFGLSDSTTIKSLQELGIQQLYPTKPFDIKTELKKLNASLLLNFIELLKILNSQESDQLYSTKIKEIQLILINFHHLLNEYRPHQARDLIIYLLQEQLKSRRSALEKIHSTIQKVQFPPNK